MVQLLTWATIAYTVILVLALAIGLIAIAYHLNGARRDLANIAAGLQVVDQQTKPVENALMQVETGLIGVRDNLIKVAENLGVLKPEAAGGVR
jgi:Na+(H+)/acetate symporter ActP